MPNDLATGIEHPALSLLNPQVARMQCSRHKFSALAHVSRSTRAHRPIDAVALLRLGNAPHGSLRRVRRDALRPQLAGELAPPLPQGLLADIDPPPLLAHGLHDQVDMRVRLVSVKHQGITVLERELLSGERTARFQHACCRRALWHRQDDVVDQLGRLAARSAAIRGPHLRRIKIQLPVFDQRPLRLPAPEVLAVIGLDLELLTTDVPEMRGDRLGVARRSG